MTKAISQVMILVMSAAVNVAGADTSSRAEGLAVGTEVRVREGGLGPGWHEGKIGIAQNGCTMVYLKVKAPGGYTSLTLKANRALQKRQGGAWVDVPLKALVDKEPKDCREADNG